MGHQVCPKLVISQAMASCLETDTPLADFFAQVTALPLAPLLKHDSELEHRKSVWLMPGVVSPQQAGGSGGGGGGGGGGDRSVTDAAQGKL